MEARACNTVSAWQVLSCCTHMKTVAILSLNPVSGFPLCTIFASSPDFLKMLLLCVFALIPTILILQAHVSLTRYVKSSSRAWSRNNMVLRLPDQENIDERIHECINGWVKEVILSLLHCSIFFPKGCTHVVHLSCILPETVVMNSCIKYKAFSFTNLPAERTLTFC